MPPPFKSSPVVAINILTNINTVETMISAHPVNCLTLVRNGVIKVTIYSLSASWVCEPTSAAISLGTNMVKA